MYLGGRPSNYLSANTTIFYSLMSQIDYRFFPKVLALAVNNYYAGLPAQ